MLKLSVSSVWTVSYTHLDVYKRQALATISIHGLSVDDEAPNKIKIVMGVIMGVIAYLLVASGGVNSVKGMWNIVGLSLIHI